MSDAAKTSVTISANQTSSGLAISAGTVVYVLSGGTEYDGTIYQGGTEFVSAGGLASETLLDGGFLIISSGGEEIGTTLHFAQAQVYGLASGVTVSSGGQNLVQSGGTALDTVVSSSGNETVNSLGTAVSAVVFSAGTEVAQGGTTLGTVVSAGGYEVVSLGQALAVSTVLEGGSQIIDLGGTASATVIGSGGFELVSGQAATYGAVVLAGGTEYAGATGTSFDTVVSSGGTLIVSNGSAVDAEISGGFAVVSIGGYTIDAVVDNGGRETVWGYGISSDTTISSGGTLVVSESLQYVGIAGSSLVLSGGTQIVDGGIAVGTTVAGGGEEFLGNGAHTTATVVESGGTQVVSGYSSNTVLSGGTMFMMSGGQAADALTFAGSGGLVEMTTEDAFIDATVSGFSDGDAIDYSFLTYSSTDSFAVSGNRVFISASGQEYAVLFDAVSPTGYALKAATDGSLELVVAPPCFARGTLIDTPRGPVDVEALQAGDLVRVLRGAPRPVRFIGRRQVDCRRHPQPESVWPVRIARDAFGPAVPARDLYLSPDHALYAEGVLIPVRHLINGDTIRQQPVAAVEYLHVELDAHDVIFAECLPAESYLDTGDRNAFANGGGSVALHPRWGEARLDVGLVVDALAYAPLHVAGPVVERVRAALRRPAPDASAAANARIA